MIKKTVQQKRQSDTGPETPENQEKLKSFLGAKQYQANSLPRLSERTDRLRHVLKKNTESKWGRRS